MLGSLRSKIRLAALGAIDDHGRKRQFDRFHRWSDPELWGCSINSAGHLAIGDVDLVDIAQQFGSPLHIVHTGRLQENYHYFLDCFRKHYPKVEIGYSYKTNPVPYVLRKLHDYGASAEVISHFELWLALKLGVLPENIIFNGPGKTLESLRLAVDRNIRIINIDSIDEISRVAELASERGVIQKVGIRLVASVGWSGQFGLSIESGLAWQAVEEIGRKTHLSLAGLHIHLGTGIKDVNIYLQAISEVLEFAEKLKRQKGIAIEFLDLGGGFGTSTVSTYTGLDRHLIEAGRAPWPADYSTPSHLENYASRIVEKVAGYFDPESPDSPLLVFEPGRAITGSAQLLMLEILTIKEGINGGSGVILDGGRNMIMPPNWEHHEALPASQMSAPGKQYYDLFGPLCHPGDLLFKGRWLPELEKGDYLAVMDSGAYFIPNQMNFSNPRTAVAAVSDSGVELVRERETFEDMISADSKLFQ